MTKEEFYTKPIGLYRVYWSDNVNTPDWWAKGFSLAAIGVTREGNRWIAPVNWVYPADITQKILDGIICMEPVYLYSDIENPRLNLLRQIKELS